MKKSSDDLVGFPNNIRIRCYESKEHGSRIVGHVIKHYLLPVASATTIKTFA